MHRIYESRSLKKLFKSGSILAALLIYHHGLAQVVPSASAPIQHQAEVTTTSQGVPLVNIVAPNVNGLSHNQYQSYSVDDRHLILNNSTQNTGTLIGGEVQANPNLSANTARLILNEVIGTERSLLQGLTEIAGNQAELILANPNGITCNGCGFINTPRSVLTTGVPQIRNQQLMSLAVNSGDIIINGAGVNTGNIDQFDLITRAITINAELLANQLNIITGRNSVDYQSLTPTPLAEGDNDPLRLSIDSSLLGGMYANTIRLVATETGVGVRLDGAMATNTGDVTLSADGMISINNVIASQGLSITSENSSIDINQQVYAKNVDLDARSSFTNQGVVAAANTINITAQSINNQSDIIAGLNTDGSLIENAFIAIETPELANSGQIIATQHASISASSIHNQNALIEAIAGDLILNEFLYLENNLGLIKAGLDIVINADQFNAFVGHGLAAGENLVINANSFNNEVEFSLDSGLNVNLAQQFSNTGYLSLSGHFSVNTSGFTNLGEGQINSGGISRIEVTGDFLNLGVYTSHNGLSIGASNIINRGVLVSGDTLTLVATSEIRNSNANGKGHPLASASYIPGDTPIDLSQSANGQNGTLLFSVGDMNLYGDSVINRFADIYSLGHLSIAKNAVAEASSLVLNSSSLMESAGNISIITQLFENRRDPILPFDNSLICENSSQIELCTSTINGAASLGIPNGTVFTTAWLADQTLAIWNIDSSYDLQRTLSYANLLNIFAAATRTSSIVSGNDLVIQAGGVSNQGGSLSAGNNLTVEANDFNSETISAVTPESVPYSGVPLDSTDVFLDSPLPPFFLTQMISQMGGFIPVQALLPTEFTDILRFPGSVSAEEISEYFINQNNLRDNFLVTSETGTFSEAELDEPNFQVAMVNYVFFPAEISAGNTLTINAGNSINLGVNQTGVTLASQPPQIVIPDAQVASDNISPPGLPTGINMTAAPFDRLDNAIPPASDFIQVVVDTVPPESNGLFTQTDNDLFLIATNPAVSGFINNFGSDLLLQQLGYQPENLTKRLGDGLYENHLIRQAIMTQTGRRFLHSSLQTDQQQFKYLMENALASQQALKLSVGVGLTPMQVASLTHDMVWLEERMVRGQKVLVPVLYLATLRHGDVLPNGSMVAYNINLNTDRLTNSTDIIADHNLTVNAKQAFKNLRLIAAESKLSLSLDNRLINQGHIASGSDLTIQTGSDLHNQGDLNSGRDMFIKVGGDLKSNRKSQINAVKDADIQANNNFIATATAMTIGGSLQLQTGDSTKLQGSDVKVGKNAHISTGGDFILESANLTGNRNKQKNKPLKTGSGIAALSARVKKSQLSLGGGLAVDSGGNTRISKSNVNTSGDTSIQTNGTFQIEESDVIAMGSQVLEASDNVSVINSDVTSGQHTFIKTNGTIENYKSSLGTGNAQKASSHGDKKVNSQVAIKPQPRANLDPLQNTGDLTLIAGLGMNSQESNLKGQSVSLVSNEGNILLDQKSLVEAHNDLLIQSGGDIKNETNLSVTNDLTLIAGGDVINEGRQLSVGNNILIDAERDIVIDSISLKRRSGSGDHYRETITHTGSTLKAGNDIALMSGRDLTIRGSEVSAEGNVILSATGDMLIANVQDEVYTFDKSTSKKSLGQKKTTTTQTLKTSNVETKVKAGNNLTINSQVGADGKIGVQQSGRVTIVSSQLQGQNRVTIAGDGVDVLSKKEISYYNSVTKKKGALGISNSQTTTINREEIIKGSQLDSLEQDLSLVSQDNITIVGSDLSAAGEISVIAKSDIDINADYDTSLDETHTIKSGLFSGGAIYSESEDLDGKTVKIAVNSTLDGDRINMDGGSQLNLKGVDISANGSIFASAQDINIANSENEATSYSRHTELSIGLGDLAKSISRPDRLIKEDNGKLSLTLATAKFGDAEEVITRTGIVQSTMSAENIQLSAISDDHYRGNINIQGSDLEAASDLTLDSSNSVNILNATETISIKSRDKQGTAELSITLKNEYDQAIRALDAIKDAERDLRHAEQALDDYQVYLTDQQHQLDQLKLDFQQGTVFIEQADIDEMEQHIQSLIDDEDFYQANIALAFSTLTSKGTALIAQTGKAAASSPTYGFNVGLELDIDAIEKQINDYYETSVASNLGAQYININAGQTTTIQGSNLDAQADININSQQLVILAAQAGASQQTRSEHQNLNYSYDIYGGNADEAANGSAAISSDRSTSNSHSNIYTNASLNAYNININAQGDTTIKGARVNASDSLVINTQNLTLESVQNTSKGKTRSQGASLSGGASDPTDPNSLGFNHGKSDSLDQQTLLTSLTGGKLEINVLNHTRIKGATIASIDEQGNDTANLDFTTNTLSASSLNNTQTSNNLSQSISIGSTASIDYQKDSENSKTKTLATLGQGNINIQDKENSDSRMLNTDVQNNEVSIFDIESHQGLQGELDTRLLSESGRDQITENILKSGMIVNSIELIITTNKVGVKDFFKETAKANTTYEAVKKEIANDPNLAQALQNPDLTPEQKEQMLNQITSAVMVKLGYEIHNNNLIATDEPGQNDQQIAGFFSTQTGEAYINDKNIGDTKGLVTTTGHEAVHAMDQQDYEKTGDTQLDINNPDNKLDLNAYADNFGVNLASYTYMALDISGYDSGMASSNNHLGSSGSLSIQENNATFSGLDKTQGDNYCSGGYECYGEQTERILRDALINPQPIETLKHYQIRERINERGIVVGYEAYNPETQNSVIMLPQELDAFQKLVEDIPTIGYSLENMTSAQHTGVNAASGLHDDGYVAGVTDAAGQYITDPNTLFEVIAGVVGAGAGGKLFRFNGVRDSKGGIENENNKFPNLYSPHTARADQEAMHGEELVTSTTLAKSPIQSVTSNPDKGIEVIYGSDGGKAVRVQFNDSLTGHSVTANIPYNSRGLPIFDDHAKFTTNIDKTINYESQFNKATRDLREAIQNGQVNKNQFSVLQIKQINSGRRKIEGYTWHHNAESGNMQLIPEKVHDAVKHIGQQALDQGR